MNPRALNFDPTTNEVDMSLNSANCAVRIARCAVRSAPCAIFYRRVAGTLAIVALGVATQTLAAQPIRLHPANPHYFQYRALMTFHLT